MINEEPDNQAGTRAAAIGGRARTEDAEGYCHGREPTFTNHRGY